MIQGCYNAAFGTCRAPPGWCVPGPCVGRRGTVLARRWLGMPPLDPLGPSSGPPRCGFGCWHVPERGTYMVWERPDARRSQPQEPARLETSGSEPLRRVLAVLCMDDGQRGGRARASAREYSVGSRVSRISSLIPANSKPSVRPHSRACSISPRLHHSTELPHPEQHRAQRTRRAGQKREDVPLSPTKPFPVSCIAVCTQLGRRRYQGEPDLHGYVPV